MAFLSLRLNRRLRGRDFRPLRRCSPPGYSPPAGAAGVRSMAYSSRLDRLGVSGE